MSRRHSVTVRIGEEKHVLRSDAPPEYTRECAAHVDAVLRDLPGSRSLDPHRGVILAAMSVTDELFRTREELRRLREELKLRTGRVAELLERAAGEEAEPPAE